jgi:hypothetical protein
MRTHGVLSIVCISFLLGCTGEPLEPVYPVSGSVTHKGKPVDGAIVAFSPAQPGMGLVASGVTDVTGVYKLTTRTAGDGAAVGTYKVAVSKYDKRVEPPQKSENSGKLTDPYDITNEYPTGYNEMQASELAASLSKNLLPAHYSNPETSKLQVEVVKGGCKLDLNLE